MVVVHHVLQGVLAAATTKSTQGAVPIGLEAAAVDLVEVTAAADGHGGGHHPQRALTAAAAAAAAEAATGVVVLLLSCPLLHSTAAATDQQWYSIGVMAILGSFSMLRCHRI